MSDRWLHMPRCDTCCAITSVRQQRQRQWRDVPERERESRSTKEDEAKFVEIEEEARGLGFRRNRRRDWHLREMHFI